MSEPKSKSDWRPEFVSLIELGPVEIRTLLQDVLDNCKGSDHSVTAKFSQIIDSIEEFEQLVQDPIVTKITSMRTALKSRKLMKSY